MLSTILFLNEQTTRFIESASCPSRQLSFNFAIHPDQPHFLCAMLQLSCKNLAKKL